MKSGKHKPKGEPKWDFIIKVELPLRLNDFKIKVSKLGRGCLKRVLKKLRIEL
jgi:hypothetical protein